ncbi:glycosyltransferase [Subsaxibacter sp. CAU 1640]|uniref:glycosyltransferase n=1 Tax=Subsaxibacter sp. CAU 1640 TaxID=2933271 RepID=UPI0020061D33|nr:glycosyltransferase [Subsaxibacter sp. CAU 1640]MCK7589531.1 glycosyltransferase [Subsaxibacter sp. CAU 1640]
MLKILIIHSSYRNFGGEDAVVQQESELLKQKYHIETLIFENQKGVDGLSQFICSIWNLKAYRIVDKKIKSFKPDFVHLHNWHYGSGPLIIRAVKKNKIPLVSTLHNYRLLCPSATLLFKNKLYLKSLSQDFPWKAVRDGVYRDSKLQTFVLAMVIWFHSKIATWNKVDLYICLTTTVASKFVGSKLGISNRKFFIKPNFTNPYKNSRHQDRQGHFIYIGRLSEEKGIRILLETFKALDEQLHIAGDGPLKGEVELVSKQHPNIRYLGILPKDDVRDQIAQSTALIFPSIWLETFGLTIIEAFSAKTIVLASNLGGPSTMIANGVNGFLFEPNSVNALKGAIQKFNDLTEGKKEQIRVASLKEYEAKYSPSAQFDYFETISKMLKSNN